MSTSFVHLMLCSNKLTIQMQTSDLDSNLRAGRLTRHVVQQTFAYLAERTVANRPQNHTSLSFKR